MANIRHIVEEKRGCGYRKPGGIYLMGGGVSMGCCKLPFELSVCPCCGNGLKFSRGFTWINSTLFAGPNCVRPGWSCPLSVEGERMGLLWIGEVYYKTTERFDREASALGISRRIARVPHGFEVGKTWVALAHIKAISFIAESGEPAFSPGIFRVFRPDRIEYVVTGSETTEELEALEKRGLSLVKVSASGTPLTMEFDNGIEETEE